MKKIFLFAFFIVLQTLILQAQSIEVFATGFVSPIGINRDAQSNLWVCESGTGNHDGRVKIIDTLGNVFVAIDSLPSSLDALSGEITGPNDVYPRGSKVRIVVGKGIDSLSGSILTYDISSFVPGTTVINGSDFTEFIDVDSWVLSNGFIDSNPFSLGFEGGNIIYISDAGANAVFKYEIPSDSFSITNVFPDILNTFTPFPPTIQYVPTTITADTSTGYFLCNLTGFPFLPGISSIVHIDTFGVTTDYVSGLTSPIDMAVKNGTGEIYTLSFGLFDTLTFLPVINSSSISIVGPDGSIFESATGFGPSAGMCSDDRGGFFVTELLTGNVLHITELATSIYDVKEEIPNPIHLFPNPANDHIQIAFNLPISESVDLFLYNLSGEKVYHENLGNLASGNQIIKIKDLNKKFNPGIYFIKIISKDFHSTNQFIIQ